jgi:hypothetical protein
VAKELVSGKVTEIYVEILNWEKFNPRKDVKLSSWFRFDHTLFEHPDFHDFTHSDLVSWMYFLCLASKKNTSSITVYVAHAERLARLTFQDLISALQKLNKIKAIIFKDVTPTSRISSHTFAYDTDTCSTRRDETVRNVTVRKSIVGIRTEYPREFNELWVKYGKRGDKKSAFEEWKRLALNEFESAQLHRAIEKYTQANDWQFRKHLHSFLKTDWINLEQPVLGDNVKPKWMQESIENNSGDEGEMSHG